MDSLQKLLKRILSLGPGQHTIVVTLDEEGEPASLSVQGSAKLERLKKDEKPDGGLTTSGRS